MSSLELALLQLFEMTIQSFRKLKRVKYFFNSEISDQGKILWTTSMLVTDVGDLVTSTIVAVIYF